MEFLWDEVLRMRIARVFLLVLLLIGFAGCKSAESSEKQAAKLMTEANGLQTQTTDLTRQWTAEYMKSFKPEDRAQFPANRDSLRAAADKIIKILDESSRLSNQALEKYEQATRLIADEQKRRGTTLLFSSLKTEVRMNEMFKSQMQLVSDESIVTEKAFNERFMQIAKEISATTREKERQFKEGRRLLGI